MKIEGLISGKKGSDEINIEGSSVPVSALNNLLKECYDHLVHYKSDKTFALWGKTCTGCLTEEQLRKKT